MSSLSQFVSDALTNQKKHHRLRQLQQSERKEGAIVKRQGKRLISFSCNDYFGLSQDKQVKEAMIKATERYGVGAGASRLITGNHPLYEALEAALAAYKQSDDALVFSSGYAANLGVIPALVGKGDVVIADKLVHASMIDGVRLSGARLIRYHHNDVAHCEQLLKQHRMRYGRCLVLTETIFSMDGDAAPITALEKLVETYDGWLVSDDAHGFGIKETDITAPKRHIHIGTLSKAIGSVGGYVCAEQEVIDYLRSHARTVVFSTGLPPGSVAAALKAVELIRKGKVDTEKPLRLAKQFTEALDLKEAESPIVPIIVGDEQKALACAESLRGKGLLVAAIRPPTVPAGSSRLRCTFSTMHTTEQVHMLSETIAPLLSA